MKEITFWGRHHFVGNVLSENPNESHTIRLSSLIRGEQIAQHLEGGKYNPKEGFEDDVIVFIKPRTMKHVKDTDWMDFADGQHLLEPLRNRPQVRVIAAAQYGYEYLKKRYPNKIIYIPQQHLNWENAKRDRKEVTTGGYIGGPSPLAFEIYGKIENKLKEIGFDFVTCYNFKKREDAVDFYKKIDFLVMCGFGIKNDFTFATPCKMINAASFGIPTIAIPQPGFKEFEGFYIPVNTMEELLVEANKLRDKDYYDMWSKKVELEAQKYHINKIIKLYEQLRSDDNLLQQ